MVNRFLIALAALQGVLAFRVLTRLARTARGRTVRPASESGGTADRVSVLLPVLNEARRIAPCLSGLAASGVEVSEILVVDGGSTDGTQAIVREHASRDARIRLIDATPVPAERNGKAHNLCVGARHASPESEWIVTIDADVRPEPGLVRSLIAHARQEDVLAASAATAQDVHGLALGALHPSMLATLVYRYGIPGHATDRIEQVQANGQCFLIRRDLLHALGGFASVMDSVCEDITLARKVAAAGHRVGFYETGGLVSVEMYADWRDAWRNWMRSLPMRDRYSGSAGRLGLAEVLLVQALPLWLVPVAHRRLRTKQPVTGLQIGLLGTRLGVHAGMRRAYRTVPQTYWLAPLLDMPVAIGLIVRWRERRHRWRGRTFTSRSTGGAAT
jgi:dolichol-phosphate mannosyltransferase